MNKFEIGKTDAEIRAAAKPNLLKQHQEEWKHRLTELFAEEEFAGASDTAKWMVQEFVEEGQEALLKRIGERVDKMENHSTFCQNCKDDIKNILTP